MVPLEHVKHVIALDEVGGLQLLFAELADHQASVDRPFGAVVNRARRGVHQDLRAIPNVSSGRARQKTPRSRALGALMPRRVSSLFAHARWSTRASRPRRTSQTALLWNSLKLVPDGHDIILYDHGFSSLWEPNRILVKRLASGLGIVCVSEANAARLRTLWNIDAWIEVIPNPLRGSISALPVKSVGEDRTASHGIVLGIAARLKSVKGVPIAIDATSRLRKRGLDAELRIAGVGPEEANLRELARTLGIDEHVTFLGHVRDIGTFMSSVDIMLAPSLREPFGLTPLESIALGVPTIASAIDGHVESLRGCEAVALIEPTIPWKPKGPYATKEPHTIPDVAFYPSQGVFETTRGIDPEVLADVVITMNERMPALRSMAVDDALRVREERQMKRYAELLEHSVTQMVERHR